MINSSGRVVDDTKNMDKELDISQIYLYTKIIDI